MNKLIFIAIFSMAFADGYSQTYNHSQLIGTKWITTWGLRRIPGSTKTNLGFSQYVGTLEFTNSEMKESYYKEYSYIRPLENFADLVRWQLQKVDPHIGAVA